MAEIIVLANPSKRSAALREHMRDQGIYFQEVSQTFDWAEDFARAYDAAETECFYLVDSQYWVYERFLFNYVAPRHDWNYVHAFATDGDPNNWLMKGYGGVYLVPKQTFDHNGRPKIIPTSYNGFKLLDIKVSTFMHNSLFAIFMLQHDEANAEHNWEALLDQHPIARREYSTGNIRKSHEKLAKLSHTQLFAVVDADCYLTKPFLMAGQEHNYTRVNVWKVKNPINGLVYGHGGPKLFGKHLFNASSSPVDMTLSLTNHVQVMDDVVGEHRFNWSGFATYRTAFREAVKLSMSKDPEAQERLRIWCEEANKKVPYAMLCLEGAQQGFTFAKSTDFDPHKINDYGWIEDLYQKKAFRK